MVAVVSTVSANEKLSACGDSNKELPVMDDIRLAKGLGLDPNQELVAKGRAVGQKPSLAMGRYLLGCFLLRRKGCFLPLSAGLLADPGPWVESPRLRCVSLLEQ